jgi:enamine deaminase RidA (YjgF/YER057c/UK114 family)
MSVERLRLFGEQFALSWAVVSNEVVYATMTGMKIDFDAPRLESFEYPHGHVAQMRQCYANFAAVLERVGSGLVDVVDQTIFFVGDPEVVAAANRLVRGEVFADAPPSSSMAGVAALHHPECLLEIKVIAHRGSGSRR